MKINELTNKQQNIFKNLERQIDSFFNKTNEKSFKTRERYRDAMYDFGKFLAKEYNKQNIKKISNSHIEKYVNCLQSSSTNYSTSYITTNISAIRFFYERVSEGKFIIKSNKQLGVIPRSKAERIGSDRGMQNDDLQYLYNEASKEIR